MSHLIPEILGGLKKHLPPVPRLFDKAKTLLGNLGLQHHKTCNQSSTWLKDVPTIEGQHIGRATCGDNFWWGGA